MNETNASRRIYWVGGSKRASGCARRASLRRLPATRKPTPTPCPSRLGRRRNQPAGWITFRPAIWITFQAATASLEELGSKLVALWMINRQRDSLELLREFMSAVPKADVHVVRNGYFGEERKFELYNGSKIREVVEGRGANRSRSRIWPIALPTTST
jgi:hypothetical protein